MFKVGDKVRCINAEGNIFITNGVVYTVEKIDRRTLKVKGGWAMYESDKFEKVEDNMFTKDMLVAGLEIKQRNGDIGNIGNTGDGRLIVRYGKNGGQVLSGWNNDLTWKNLKENRYDIVEVWEKVFSRQEKTKAEKQLDELDAKITELQEQADKVRKSMQDE